MNENIAEKEVVVMCAWTGKIKVGKRWLSKSSALDLLGIPDLADKEVSHSICPEAATEKFGIEVPA